MRLPFLFRRSRPDDDTDNLPHVASPSPVEEGTSASDSPADTTSPQRGRSMSKDSEGYPTWLPKRPAPPAPRSTFRSSQVDAHELPPTASPVPPVPIYGFGGRRQTPRSVRVVSLQDEPEFGPNGVRRETTDDTRVPSGNHQRVWSRATAPLLSNTPQPPPPRFRSRGLRLEILHNPSKLFHCYFYLYRLAIFLHIPLQFFFDFNAVYVLFQASKYPNDSDDGRTWTLAVAAYIACWALWVLGVLIAYELIYSFIRRWRIKRPLMEHIYFSTPAFNYVAISSYTKFCFLQHIRYSAFIDTNWKDGVVETFWFYSQNLPTVALQLPRAGIALAAVLSFAHPNDNGTMSNIQRRDSTFFRDDGTLTSYARGVLLAGAALTAWKCLVLFTSWFGLWLFSGQLCGGVCGPRDRWGEEDVEKMRRSSVYSVSNFSVYSQGDDILPWTWREFTSQRIRDSYELCMPGRRGKGKEISDSSVIPEQILAAIGLGGPNQPARRNVLSDDFWHGEAVHHRTETPPELSSIIPTVRRQDELEAGPTASGSGSGPLMSLPYPFTAPGAAYSSKDKVLIPFPPSPVPSDEKSPVDHDDEVEDEDEDVGSHDQRELSGSGEGLSSGRASNSMSSLGHPVSPRYPFQFRLPSSGVSDSAVSSSGLNSHSTNSRGGRSSDITHSSMMSRVSQSTGNRDSSDSHSPRSRYTTSTGSARVSSGATGSPDNSSSAGSRGVIPPPPRRHRAGTVPGSPSPGPAVQFPGRSHRRTASEVEEFGNLSFEMDPDASDVLEEEEDVENDSVGLLSPASASHNSSPRHSLRHRASSLLTPSSSSRSRSRTNSHNSSSSRSRTGSMTGSAHVVRSRAQSLMQSVSQSSLAEYVQRSRTNSSLARLEEDDYLTDKTHSRSGSSSNAENYTFGLPLPGINLPRREERIEDIKEESASQRSQESVRERHEQEQASRRDVREHRWSAASEGADEADVDDTARIPVPSVPSITEANASGSPPGVSDVSSSPPGVSTANPSFVTAPPTVDDDSTTKGSVSDNGEGTVWGSNDHNTSWRPM